MQLTLNYFRVDPAGNITGFVVGAVRPEQRAPIARAIMREIDPSVEQVGFITPDADGHPARMDMMGGEFCGNATRSFGLYAARLSAVAQGDIPVEVSGMDGSLSVHVDCAASSAFVAMPPARGVLRVGAMGGEYPVVDLGGIVHAIAEMPERDEAFVRAVVGSLSRGLPCEAYGLLFLDRAEGRMVPYVYVVESDTLVREGSCASGSCAVAHFLNDAAQREDFSITLRQPRGELEVRAQRDEAGRLVYAIGGRVEIGPMERITVSI